MLFIKSTQQTSSGFLASAACSPEGYIDEIRRREAVTAAAAFNKRFGKARAYVDTDNDVMFDEKRHPDRHAMALADKRFRSVVRERAAVLREMLVARHPRLAAVPVDVLSLGHLHAGAGPSPGGGDVVLLSTWLGWLGLWYEWVHCFILVESPPFGGDGERVANVELTRMLAQAIGGATAERFAIITRSIQSLESRLGQEFLRSGKGSWHAHVFLQTFIVFHEFGHIALGHTDAIRTWKPDGDLTANQLAARRELQRQFEFEADRFVVDSLMAIRSPDGTPEGEAFRNDGFLRAALLLFLLVDMASREMVPVTSAEAQNATHPPALERLRRIAGLFDVPESADYLRFIAVWSAALAV